jgi:PhnB protein
MADNSPSMPPVISTIAPWLPVSDGDRAVAYYQAAFGAVERYHLADSAGRVLVARLSVDAADFWIQAAPGAKPGGDADAIRLILTVDDPETVFHQALLAGATAIGPIVEDHGWRSGRLVDPFGHQWEVGKPIGE